MLVSLPSHTHHVPQVGRPQIEPVARQIAVKHIPGTAAARAAIAANGWRQTRKARLAKAIVVHPPIPNHAAGTCRNRIRTVSPISRSGGTSNRPQPSAPPASANPDNKRSGVSQLASARNLVGLAKPCMSSETVAAPIAGQPRPGKTSIAANAPRSTANQFLRHPIGDDIR